MKLWVDDVRQAPEGWTRARTVTEALRILWSQGGGVTELSLDHDIFHEIPGGTQGRYTSCPESYAAIAYALAMCGERGELNKIYLHSANPDGRKTMMRVLKLGKWSVEERPFIDPN